MKTYKFLATFIFTVSSSSVFAFYGGSTVGGMKSCEPPELDKFTPAHLSVVIPQSEFSFTASKKISPQSIAVTAKKQAVEITVDESDEGYVVSGKLPVSLNNTYARIEIKAVTAAGCKGGSGWLLNIRESEKLSATSIESAVPVLSED